MKHFPFKLSKVYTLMILLSVIVSCTKEQTDNGKPNIGTGEGYIASDSVITRTLKSTSLWLSEYVIYEDFNFKHELVVGEGRIGISPFERIDGEWDYSGDKDDRGGFKSIGKVQNLSDITEKCSVGEGVRDINDNLRYECFVYVADIQPDYGYTGCFLTSDGTYKYIRLRITAYTLDAGGGLDTVTVQYQLF